MHPKRTMSAAVWRAMLCLRCSSPTASATTIAKADGIKWLAFATSLDTNKAVRAAKCNRASVCIANSEYNITLVGGYEG